MILSDKIPTLKKNSFKRIIWNCMR